MIRNVFFAMSFGLLLMQVPTLMAQQNWEYGDYADEGPLKKAILQDNYESAPEAALPALQWLLAYTPKAHMSLYIYATSVYNAMVDISLEKEEYEAAMAYADTAMILYDKRIELYGEREKVIPYKAYYAYYYWSESPEKAPELYQLYQESIKIQGKESPAIVVEDYMRLVSARKHAFDSEFIATQTDETVIAILDNITSLGEISEDEIIAIYDELMAIAEANAGDPEQDWAGVKTFLDETFQATVKIDCDYVKKTFGAKYQADPNSIENAEVLVAQMLNAGCEIANEPMFEQALALLYSNEPTYSRCMALAVLAKSKGDNASYLKYVEEGIALASSNEDKAKAYMTLAQNSTYGQAREFAFKAAEYGGAYEAYTYVGDLYMQSGGMCTNENPVLAKACYLAAYDMYAKAGNNAKMGKAQQYFPTAEEIFTYGLEAGQSISVGCWIGGTTVLRKR